MPANVGEMFYTGETPWHGLGVQLAKPATLDEALKVGGLRWSVGDAELMTAESPPSPVPKRKAIVRLDRPAGHDRRVLGVAHRGFTPVQNADAGMLFDAIFGHGGRVYHTGGYLGDGEVVWLLAKIDRSFTVGRQDVIEPYALMANSHDGSMAFNIRLTTIRVVCQNTLSMAMSQRLGVQFRRSHQGTLAEHAQAAQEYFASTLLEVDSVSKAFTRLAKIPCPDAKFAEILVALLPEPKRPRNAERNPGLLAAWERRRDEVKAARGAVSRLRHEGKGMDFEEARGTFWGVLNAVLEYVDHHHRVKGDQLAYALLGDGMELKQRAFTLLQDEAAKAA